MVSLVWHAAAWSHSRHNLISRSPTGNTTNGSLLMLLCISVIHGIDWTRSWTCQLSRRLLDEEMWHQWLGWACHSENRTWLWIFIRSTLIVQQKPDFHTLVIVYHCDVVWLGFCCVQAVGALIARHSVSGYQRRDNVSVRLTGQRRQRPFSTTPWDSRQTVAVRLAGAPHWTTTDDELGLAAGWTSGPSAIDRTTALKMTSKPQKQMSTTKIRRCRRHWRQCELWLLESSSTAHWSGTITCTQTELLESIQKRAICVIFPFTREISYSYALFAANLNFSHSRHHDISKSFFQDICDPSSCINHLLPTPRDTFCFIPAQNSHASPAPILLY